MSDILRQEIARAASSIVIKVGTRVLTDGGGQLDDARIAHLAEEIHELVDHGRRVIVVSSGAVGAGMSTLGIQKRPRDVAQLQAVAAIGQAKLIESYDRHLRRNGRHAAQILLTADDFYDRKRYLNVRNTLFALFKTGAVPIVNENDSVAVDELQATFGDNDRLAAMVTNLVRATLLVILSDVDGLYDGDPNDPGSCVVPTVTRLDDSIRSYVCDSKSGQTKGGMGSKLEAARMATMAGESVIIASGHEEGIIRKILSGQNVGTLFVAQGKSVSPRKRWIGFSAQPRGQIRLDNGAQQAVEIHGRSLLPIGVSSVEGQFEKGDIVALCDHAGREFARGLCNYDSTEVQQIKGLRSDKIAEVLGHCPYEEVLHRDNITLI